jgi:hypothetical protein
MFYDFFWNIPLKTTTYPIGLPVKDTRSFNISAEAPFADVSLTYNFGKGKKKSE